VVGLYFGSKGTGCQGHDLKNLAILSLKKMGLLFDAPFFDSRVNFKVLVAMVLIANFKCFKEVVVLTLKIKNGVIVRVTFHFGGLF